MSNQEIETLKELSKFNQDKLDQVIEEAKSRYETSENFVFQNPGEMLKELKALYTKGYEPTSAYMHQILPPMFYSIWLVKPVVIQQSELVDVIARAEASYRADLETYKQQWLQAAALEQLKTEEARAAQVLQVKREKRLSEITKQLLQEGI